jgi:hypothetical protein
MPLAPLHDIVGTLESANAVLCDAQVAAGTTGQAATPALPQRSPSRGTEERERDEAQDDAGTRNQATDERDTASPPPPPDTAEVQISVSDIDGTEVDGSPIEEELSATAPSRSPSVDVPQATEDSRSIEEEIARDSRLEASDARLDADDLDGDPSDIVLVKLPTVAQPDWQVESESLDGTALGNEARGTTPRRAAAEDESDASTESDDDDNEIATWLQSSPPAPTYEGEADVEEAADSQVRISLFVRLDSCSLIATPGD